ncbi:type I DNA topoisomerase [Erysipelotrichaceae bacterium OttesenSCG-928-M19]|nr:type I DNA topoisomerase [Erysipelotrichaceae bacterium OttesenSCG-928-M19]
MASKLVIVESPSKSKTIEKYLGSDYQVLSSKGHIRDLATSGKGGLGIDVENGFVPTYIDSKDKKDVIKELKKASKGKEVFLATDPDREGEAISWHLMQVLELDKDNKNRIVFNEVTKDAVTNALENPRQIDFDLVSSQETRRMLDRIIGFKLSSLLKSKIKSQSAGRVQSVALKLICERQKEIDAFIPEEYYTIEALFNHDKIDFEASLAKFKNKKIELKTSEEAQEVLDALSKDFLIKSIKEKSSSIKPKLAFITSTLQQEAYSKLGFNSKKTMRIAQALYEGIDLKDETVGLITYMRTDSNRLNDTFVQNTFSYIEETYGKEYIGSYAFSKSKGNVQDAHEGIRPTSITMSPDSIKKYLSADQFKLYELIYARTLASLMKPAKKNSTTIILENNNYDFNANGSVLTFDGYKKVYEKFESASEKKLPVLQENTNLQAKSIDKNQHFTKGPAAYTESSLIKELEELKIGRPSTYSAIIETLKLRKYVNYEEKKFIPTEQGILTNEELTKFFSEIINVSYTAQMEEELDEISQGELESLKVLTEFYQKFEPLLENAKENMEKIPPKPTGEKCPECGHDLVYRQGRYGEFIACSNYPECKYIKKEEKKVEYTGENCPQCGSPMVKRYSAKTKSEFEGCSNFPKCRYIKPTPDEIVPDEKCPTCQKEVVIRQGRYGKFKCCIDYPKCKTIIKD